MIALASLDAPLNSGLAIFIGYLMGSVPFAFIFARAKGIDLRTVGSGNIGATNAGRAMGLHWFFIIFSCDAGKGALAVTLATLLLAAGEETQQLWYADAGLFAGAGAILGHTFPFALRFKGGKAVATGVGVLVCIAPLAAAVCVIVFLLVLAVTRYVSMASLLAALSAPLVYGFLAEPPQFEAWGTGRLVFLCIIAVLICYLHRSNIKKLLAGTEHRIGSKGKPSQLDAEIENQES